MDFKSMLDDLMGPSRDVMPSDRDGKKEKPSFTAPDVCKCYLVQFCPNELFSNTKSDLGDCTKKHYQRTKMEWDALKPEEQEKHRYDEEFLDICEPIIRDCDRRINARKRDIERGVGPQIQLNDKETQYIDLKKKVAEAADEISRLGEEGKFSEANTLMQQVEGYKKTMEGIQQSLGIDPSTKCWDVCEVCGLFTGADPNGDRNHLLGKQHLGFEQLRKAVEEVRKKLREQRKSRDERRDREGQEKDRERVDRSDRRDRDRDRDRADRRERSRSRDRDRRDRPHDRDRRDRDRDRRREDRYAPY